MVRHMIDKFAIEVALAVIAVDNDPTQRHNSKFLVIKRDGVIQLPQHRLVDEEISREVAYQILERYTGITSEWGVLFPFGAVDDGEMVGNERVIYLLFGMFIPEPTRVRVADSEWLTYDSLIKRKEELSVNTFKLIEEAVWRQV
jgi:hypothetical protein